MIIASVAIYISSSNFRKEDFYTRLENKAINTAKLLVDVEEINAELLRRIEKDNPTNLPKERIIIYSNKDSALYNSDEKKTLNISKFLIDRVRRVGSINFKQDSSEVIGLLYAGHYDRFVVIAAATDIHGLRKLKNLRIILTLVFFASLILFSLAGWFYAGKALQPISSVIAQVESISITSLDLRVDEGRGTDEIAHLAKTFNKMLDRLEVAFKTQKDFISNASHELRTPLTSIRGQLEVLILKDRSSIDYKNVLDSVLEDIKNISNLLNRLLLLAQTSSEVVFNKFLPVRIDEILFQAVEDLKRYNHDFIILISLNESITDSDQLMVEGDEFLLKTAMVNIIENACKYSLDHTVNIGIDYLQGWVTLVFVDQGIGISEEDIEKLFNPFHRGLNAKSIPGDGIGLPLVQRIIKSHKGIILVNSKLGEGTTVTIKLPSTYTISD